jgi:hypothetical protein
VPFLLKRVYLKTYFEIYVNSDQSGSENNLKKEKSSLNYKDINDIISGELIPRLNLGSIYQYLEGLKTLKNPYEPNYIQNWLNLKENKLMESEKDLKSDKLKSAIRDEKKIVDECRD